MTKPARFLILRGGAIGDFILTLPAIQALRARWPDAWIELVGYPHIANLALDAGLVNRVESLDRAGMARFFASRPLFTDEQASYIRSFDLVLSYLHDPDGVVQRNLLLAGARQVLYTSPLVETGHAVAHLLKPLESLAIYEQDDRPHLELSEEIRSTGRRWLAERRLEAPVLALHPGSGSARKNWPADFFVELAVAAGARWGGSAFYILGEADRDAAAVIARRDPKRAILSGRTLTEVGSVLTACQAFVGNDSGITHLAAAVGVPTIALFGLSDAARWGPRGARVRVLQAPAGDLGRIRIEEVLDALVEILGTQPSA